MPTIFEQIITDVRKRDFAAANDNVREALQRKVAERLAEEKTRLSESDDDPAADGERAAKLDNAIAAAEKRGDKDEVAKLKARAKESGRDL
jgi:hypothetical protein